ncbi:MAG: exodeoxyribonuclease VII small subunit [Oscillospiraceae bacterium]|nr:exodeoxyribonuclease VII small subunit [Oscillospiraceae bacterium]
MDFEKEMAKLAEISQKMKAPDLPLEESMKLYTEAVGLTKSLKEYIDNAKLTVEKLEEQ